MAAASQTLSELMTTSVRAAPSSLKDFMRAVGTSSSYQDEQRIVSTELCLLKQSEAPHRIDKPLMVKLLFASLLGHDISPFHGVVLESIAAKDFHVKRLGYMLLVNAVSSSSYIRMTAVNTLLADLTSSSMLHVQLALTTLSYVLTADTVPIFRDKVTSKLSCDAPPIRRGALSALHKMYSIDGPAVDDRLTLKIQAAVCDADPSVMACVLPLIIDELERDRSALTKVGIVSSALCILKQVLEGKLNKSFEYFGVPAPWIQVRYSITHLLVITVQCSASCLVALTVTVVL
jgi:AP-4 complex subunit epsilon-1